MSTTPALSAGRETPTPEVDKHFHIYGYEKVNYWVELARDLETRLTAALAQLGEAKRESANMVQILRCASGKHELSMRIDDCAYCKLESAEQSLSTLRTSLDKVAGELPLSVGEIARCRSTEYPGIVSGAVQDNLCDQALIAIAARAEVERLHAAIDALPELNPLNYTDDDVRELNDAAIKLWQTLAKSPAGGEGERG